MGMSDLETFIRAMRKDVTGELTDGGASAG